MLFQVEMDVALPHNLDPAHAAELKRVERERSQELQRQGRWRHLWRVAGRYANTSIFDVSGADELHELISTLPLFPYMIIKVTALCRHGSSIRADDR